MSDQKWFSSLCIEDQTDLLALNLPLYIKYTISRYLTAETGLEQLSWILLDNLPIESIDEIQNLKQIHYEEMRFFESPYFNKYYLHQVNQVKLRFPFPNFYNGLLANFLLSSTDGSKNFRDQEKIKRINEESRRLIESSLSMLDTQIDIPGKDHLESFVKLLRGMEQLFLKSSVGQTMSQILKHLEVPYTEFEENWLQGQLARFQESHRSTYIPREFLSEYLDLLKFGSQKTPSRSLMSLWLKMSKERIWNVFRTYEEFSNSSIEMQGSIWLRNHLTAIGLTSAMLNSTQSGKKQLKGVLGHFGENDNTWEVYFNGSIDLENLKPVELSRVSKGILDKRSLKIFHKLVEEISSLICNEQLFHIMMIIILFDTGELPSKCPMASVREYHLRFFQRKLFSAKLSFVEYSHFHKVVKMLKEFSSLLDLFLI